MALAAKNATDRVEQLILLTERLTSLIQAEREALEAKNHASAEALQREAAPLANLYRQECDRIRQYPALVADAPQDRRAALAQRTERFHDALDAHAKIVAALKQLTEGLVRSIADHVAENRTQQSGYGPGAVEARARAGSAITLNRTA